MEVVKMLFDVNYVWFTVIGYPMTVVELIGTIAGLACVILAAKENIWTWPIGIINMIFFFALFYQVRLYSDALLQIVFFALTIYGWWKWLHPSEYEWENAKGHIVVNRMSTNAISQTIFWGSVATILLGFYMSNIHNTLPTLFPEPAAAPFRDAFTTVFSVIASYLMAKKYFESWVLWFIIDVVATIYYFNVGIALVGIEYIIFGLNAVYGFTYWLRSYKKSINEAT